MLFVVTEKGHNFYWQGKDLKAGTEFEARIWEMEGPLNMQVVMRKADYQLLKTNRAKFELDKKKELFSTLNNPLITGDELLNMKYIPKEWLIDSIIPKRGLTIVGGDPKTFKSYWSLIASCCMVQGLPILGKKTQKITVLYLDEENGSETMRQRMEKIKLSGLIKDSFPNFYLSVFNNFKLDNPSKFSLVKIMIEELKPDLVVIDSLVRFFEGDENSANDARQCFETLKNLMEDYGTSFLILHHNKKSTLGAGNRLRGSGDFTAMADVIMEISKSKDYFVMTQTENRHKENIPAFSFKIEDMENGGLALNFLGELEDQQSKKDRAAEIIDDFLRNDATDIFSSSNVYERTRCDNISDKTVQRVLKDLVLSERLVILTKGKYKKIQNNKLVVN